MASNKIHILDTHVMNYAWGRPGYQSSVAKLSGALVDPTKTYAELWMGTHKNGPAQVPAKAVSLQEFIGTNPQVLAPHENGDIQYLFKVLSVAKALSVQSHPTKELAKELHAKDPKNYPDGNHKPEMTVALTEFEILCGFRKVEEIAKNFEAFPEMVRLVSESQIKSLRDAASADESVKKAAIKDLFTSMMKASPENIEAAIKVLMSRLGGTENNNELETLVQRLYRQYPDADVGVFAPLLLNHIKLQPGESVFLGPNEPHAYLDGECIECMACSDNTIRAGLTPKFKDVPTLVSTLTYNTAGPTYLSPVEVVPGVFEYKPPVPEFTVQRITKTARRLNDVKASSILIVIEGSVTLAGSLELNTGKVVFIEASAGETELSNVDESFLAFRAFTPAP